MKNIFITEKQYNFLNESVLKKTQSNNILYNNNSPLSPLISPEQEEKMIKKREGELSIVIDKLFGKESTKFVEKIPYIISQLLTHCNKKENKIKEILEKMCYDSVFELFNCPDGIVNLSCNLVSKIDSSNTTLHINPIDDDVEFESSSEIDITETEIQKRKLINAIIIGGSIVLTKIILKNKKNEINNLDKSLYEIYNKLLWINEYYLFNELVNVTDDTPNQTGGVDVKLGNDNKQTVIDSKALCFPILLFETIKGFFELFVSHGLPNDKKMAEYVIDQSDSLKFQQYSMVVGPILWNKIMSIMHVNDIDTSLIPHLMYKLSKLQLNKFNDIIKEIVLNTKLGKQILEDMLLGISNEIDYDDFEERLNQKRSEKSFLNDSEYLRVDELLDEYSEISK